MKLQKMVNFVDIFSFHIFPKAKLLLLAMINLVRHFQHNVRLISSSLSSFLMSERVFIPYPENGALLQGSG